MPAFEIPIAVTPADIDELGHVNNTVYLRWVQEAAVAHWRAVAPAGDQATVIWVVVRHEIDYKRPAHLGDSLIARTWVGSAARTRFERFTEILPAAGGAPLAKALTIWCPLDRESARPVNVSPEVRALFSTAE